MDEEAYANLNGRLVAVELATTTLLTVIVTANSAPENYGAFVERMRQDTLSTFHVLDFPDTPEGMMIRHEAAEAIDRLHGNVLGRLFESHQEGQ